MLASVLAHDKDNILALLWMTKCTPDPNLKLAYFKRVLELDPANPHAIKGLALFGTQPKIQAATHASEANPPVPPPASSLQIVKEGYKWRVAGTPIGWLHETAYATRWRAQLAAEVFSRGGTLQQFQNDAGAAKRQRRKMRPPRRRTARHAKRSSRDRAIAVCRRRVGKDPGDPEAHFALGLALLSGRLPGALRLSSTFYRSPKAPGHFSAAMRDAADHLNGALALGLDSHLDAARARLILVVLHASQKFATTGSAVVTGDPRARALARQGIEDTKRQLRLTPNDIFSITIQKTLYNILGDRDGEGDSGQALAEASALASLSKSAPGRRSHPKRRAARRPDGLAFELKIQALMRTMGLTATTTKASHDGGVDIVAVSPAPIIGGRFIIQCKDWSKPVGEPVVRDLFGAVHAEGASKGILITSGKFTEAAIRFALGKPIELIDGERLKILADHIHHPTTL